MKFILFLTLLFIPAIASAQQSDYELDAWFWHRNLSTSDSTFTQDYDNDEHRIFIPLHLTQQDFDSLDAAAEKFGLWSQPDTIPATETKMDGASIMTDGWQMYFYFRTPKHPQPKVIASKMVTATAKIYDWESAILKVMDRQPYYNTLPKPMKRY